jgi:hypothetical protein
VTDTDLFFKTLEPKFNVWYDVQETGIEMMAALEVRS